MEEEEEDDDEDEDEDGEGHLSQTRSGPQPVDHVLNRGLSTREAGQRVQPKLRRYTVASIICPELGSR